MNRVGTALLVLLLSAGTGCLTLFTDPLGRQQQLVQIQRKYTNMIRWGQIERASELVDPQMRQEFLGYVPSFERFHITDFEIGKIRYDDEGDAHVSVTYSGYSLTSLTEQSIREEQEWYSLGGMSLEWRVRPQIAGIANAFVSAAH